MPPGNSYGTLRTTFRWAIPESFNIGVACSDAQPAGDIAVVEITPAAGGTALRLLLFNVFTDNLNSAAVLELVRRETPDVVILQEIDDRWAAEVQGLEAILPHSKVITRTDNFGIGLWSRLPLARAEEIAFGDYELPSIHASVQVAGREITLVATHPMPPASAAGFAERNAQLSMIAALVQRSAAPAIVIGDLNTTMWSPYFAKLLRESGLADARKGFGILPTWPAGAPVLRIPLDHCLASPSLRVMGIRTGQAIGSDHLPLIVDLWIPPADVSPAP